MDKDKVKAALEAVLNSADYDLAKQMDPECNETGEDGWPELVEIFINAYEKADR